MDEWIKNLNNIPPHWSGALLAIFVSILRIIYDQSETSYTRIALESAICGALSLTATYAVLALELNHNWAIFSGGAIGYLGSNTIRMIAFKMIRKELSGD